jgi:hypothetical protein
VGGNDEERRCFSLSKKESLDLTQICDLGVKGHLPSMQAPLHIMIVHDASAPTADEPMTSNEEWIR